MAILIAAIVVRPSVPWPLVSRTKNRLIMTIASDRAQVTIPDDVERSAGYLTRVDAVYDRRIKEEVAKLTNLAQRVSSSIQIVLGTVASLDRMDCRAQRVFCNQLKLNGILPEANLMQTGLPSVWKTRTS